MTIGNVFELKNNVLLKPITGVIVDPFFSVPINFSSVDTKDYEALLFAFNFGNITDDVTITFGIVHGEEQDLSDGELCTQEEIISDIFVDGILTIIKESTYNAITVGYIGKKRYATIRVLSLTGSVISGVPLCFQAFLSSAHSKPVEDIITSI